MTAYNKNDETSCRRFTSEDSPNPSSSLEPQAKPEPQDCRDDFADCRTCCGDGFIQDEYVENAVRTCPACDGNGVV